MPEIHLDPRMRREFDADVHELQERINKNFDFDEVVGGIFALIEKKTNYRGCRLSALGRDLSKRPLVDSPTVPKKAKTPRCPVLSYPLPLTNGEIRYTLDIYAFEASQLTLPGSDLLGKYIDLLYQSVNKDYHERDYLTGLYNRRGLEPRLARLFEAAHQKARPAAFLMMDLDHFKRFNDTYGHPVGDLVLFEFASLLADNVPPGALLGRWGGEEFIAVFPGYEQERAWAAAEDIRTKTEKLKIWVDREAGKFEHPSCSIGLSLFPAHAEDIPTLISLADLALYDAKQAGRNQVKVYPLDAPALRLKKLGEHVAQRGAPPRPDIENRCRFLSLKDAGIVSGLPLAVAVAGPVLYTLDGQTNRVFVYDGKAKKVVAEFGGRGEDLRELEGPVDLAVAAGERVFVVDAPSHAVKVYGKASFLGFLGGRDPAGAPVPGVIKGSFNWPIAVAADAEGRVLVAEHLNRRVQRFDREGKFDELEIPLLAADQPPTYQPDPRDVAADGAGNVYVLDAANNVINKYDGHGGFVAAIGGPATAAEEGRFRGLVSLEVENNGKIAARLAALGVGVAADTREILVAAESGDVNRLQFFDALGAYLAGVDFGKLEGKLGRLVRPGRLAVSAGGRIYLVDQVACDVIVITLGTEG